MDHLININMNWGRGLTIAIVGFIAAMLGMVYISFQQTNEMIEDHYYERELKYQNIIDAKNALDAYSDFSYLDISNNLVHISIPKELTDNFQGGTVRFLKFDKESLDKRFPVTKDNLNQLQFPISDFVRGEYRVKISWKNGSQDYFHEKDYTIQ